MCLEIHIVRCDMEASFLLLHETERGQTKKKKNQSVQDVMRGER